MSSTQFDGDIDSFVSYLKSNRGLSANTLKAYRADLTACLHLFELRGVTDPVSYTHLTLPTILRV